LIFNSNLILSRDYFPSPTPILYTCNMTCYDKRMRVGPKHASQFIGCNDISNWVSKQCLIRKYRSSVILKIVLFFNLGSYIWRKKKQISGIRTWECWWGSRSRSTPEATRLSRGRRQHTRGQDRPRSSWVDPSRLYHIWLF
jgi:hypothetical protein